MTYLALGKPGLAGLVTAAAVAGYLAAAPGWSAEIVWVAAGVFALAAGAAALNEYQEREIDARMDRTKDRPIPSGRVRPEIALAVAVLLIGGGLLALGRGGTGAVLLGGAAAAWYNGIYTPLKKRSPLAAVPGALSGALAPVVGGVFAGARPDDLRLVLLAVVIFVWQIPHFWLVVIARAREFRTAGLPVLLDVWSETGARRAVALLVMGTAAASLAMAGFGAFGSAAARGAVLALSLWLAGRGVWYRVSAFRHERALFRTLNFHLAALFLALCLDRLLV